MNEMNTQRAGPGGIVVWMAVILGLCLALTVGVAAEVNAQTVDCLYCHVEKDSKQVCAFQPGEKVCMTFSYETCSMVGFAWAILTGDIEACQSRTETWYWA